MGGQNRWAWRTRSTGADGGPCEGDPRSAPGMRRAPCRRASAAAAELNLPTIFPGRYRLPAAPDRAFASVGRATPRQNYALGDPSPGEGKSRPDEGTRALSGNYTRRSHVTTTNRRISLPVCLPAAPPAVPSGLYEGSLASGEGVDISAGCSACSRAGGEERRACTRGMFCRVHAQPTHTPHYSHLPSVSFPSLSHTPQPSLLWRHPLVLTSLTPHSFPFRVPGRNKQHGILTHYLELDRLRYTSINCTIFVLNIHISSYNRPTSLSSR